MNYVIEKILRQLLNKVFYTRHQVLFYLQQFTSVLELSKVLKYCHHNNILHKKIQLKSVIKVKQIKNILQTRKLLLLNQKYLNHVKYNNLKNSIKNLRSRSWKQ